MASRALQCRAGWHKQLEANHRKTLDSEQDGCAQSPVPDDPSYLSMMRNHTKQKSPLIQQNDGCIVANMPDGPSNALIDSLHANVLIVCLPCSCRYNFNILIGILDANTLIMCLPCSNTKICPKETFECFSHPAAAQTKEKHMKKFLATSSQISLSSPLLGNLEEVLTRDKVRPVIKGLFLF